MGGKADGPDGTDFLKLSVGALDSCTDGGDAGKRIGFAVEIIDGLLRNPVGGNVGVRLIWKQQDS